MLELNDLNKAYTAPSGKAVQALGGVSLTVAPGDFVALMGPSGCGKTSLLLIAGGLLAPDSGTVRVDGDDFYALGGEARAARRASTIGFVFQQFHLVPYLTVQENILAPGLALPKHEGRERSMELMETFGLSDRSNHRPGELSTGERQRTALARALFNRPRILLADEPTGNLDEANANIVLSHLADFAKESGAVLMVTHQADAAKRASRIVEMKAGQLQPA